MTTTSNREGHDMTTNETLTTVITVGSDGCHATWRQGTNHFDVVSDAAGKDESILLDSSPIEAQSSLADVAAWMSEALLDVVGEEVS